MWENNAEQALMSLTSDTGNLYTRGQIYAGNSTSNLVLNTGNVAAGAGISVVNSAGTVTIANTGVTSFNTRTGAVALTLAVTLVAAAS